MKVYFDNSSSTKMLDEFKETFIKVLDNYANPSSIHSEGKKVRYELEKSREKIAKILNVNSSELIFTSSATEANNHVLKSFTKGHIITSKIEHSSILKVCEYLEKQGLEITYLDVDEKGMVNIEDLKKAIKENTVLVSIMSANNETGVRQPIKEIGEFLKDKNIYFHSDITQSLMKEKLDIKKLNLDFFSASFHKFHCPKGLGLLYIKDGIFINKLLHGGMHEKNKRAGTENYQAIIYSSKVMEYLNENLDKNILYVQNLKNFLIKELEKFKGKIKINNIENTIPNILNIQIIGKDIEYILPLLDMNGICVSGGSACNSGILNESKVLLAQGLTKQEAKSSIRISFSIQNTVKEIKYFVSILNKILN